MQFILHLSPLFSVRLQSCCVKSTAWSHNLSISLQTRQLWGLTPPPSWTGWRGEIEIKHNLCSHLLNLNLQTFSGTRKSLFRIQARLRGRWWAVPSLRPAQTVDFFHLEWQQQGLQASCDILVTQGVPDVWTNAWDTWGEVLFQLFRQGFWCKAYTTNQWKVVHRTCFQL